MTQHTDHIQANELQYRTLLREELQAAQALMLKSHSDLPASVTQAFDCIINSSGKRLRPALVLLSAHLCHADLERALPLAAAIEMLHTATLIHDDLIDHALVRRGTSTLNAQWPPSATVLAGDLAFAWAATLAARVQDLTMMDRFAETLETICYGELNQMFKGRGAIPTIEEYRQRIFAKTASLFALAMEAGPLLAGSPPAEIENLRRFGELLGTAFQIADDVLDFMGDEATLGKPIGSDLRQGLITLPLLYYLEGHPADQRIQALAQAPADETQIQALIADLRSSHVAARAMSTAEGYIHAALDILQPYPPSPYRAALEEIAVFTTRRRY